MERFLTYNHYIKRKYGKKGYRISIDAGFSCPNRSSDRLSGGCTFCDEAGSRPARLSATDAVSEQIQKGLNLARKKYNAEVFFLYFQSFTSTFAPLSVLDRIYSSALKEAPFKELIVSTRPDCLPEETLDLLCKIRDQYNIDLWIELGLQSIHDDTLLRINRGHDFQTFKDTWKRLKNRGIKGTIHLILGLPGENESRIKETITTVAALKPDGLKFHNLHIPEKSLMYQEFLAGEIPVMSNSRYIRLVAWAIERLPPETVIIRIATDTPISRSGRYPGLVWNKQQYYGELETLLLKKDSRQGLYYENSPSVSG